MPAGPAALAIATGRVLFPATLWVRATETVGVHPPDEVDTPTTGDTA